MNILIQNPYVQLETENFNNCFIPNNNQKNRKIKWTDVEDKILREHFYNITISEIQKLFFPYRTVSSISSHAFWVGLRKQGYKKWSQAEEKLLKKEYTFASKKHLKELFPDRELPGIRTKAIELGIAKRVGFKKAPLKNTPTISLTEIEKAQLAAIIDSEGTISLKNCKTKLFNKSPYIYVDNTHHGFMLKIKDLFRTDKKIGFRNYEGTNRKDIYCLVITKKEHIYVILKEILPYLIVKRRQAELIIKWIELFNEIYINFALKKDVDLTELLNITSTVSKLNRRGRN